MRVIAPSGPFDTQALEAGIAVLRTRYTVVVRDDISSRAGYLAGDDQRRAGELIEALEDDQTAAIIAARGGYGATRILSQVAATATRTLRQRPKLLVGCSDITALHALWQRSDVGSLHAHMVTRVPELQPAQQTRWLDALQGRSVAVHDGLNAPDGMQPPRASTASGRLCGGNLAVLYALLGTAHWPNLDGRILVLEDINERPYAIDRMLTALRDSGALQRVAGVVLGAFTKCAPGTDGMEVAEVLAERLGDLGVPVASGLSVGHIEDNRELPLGCHAYLDLDAGTLTLTESPQSP